MSIKDLNDYLILRSNQAKLSKVIELLKIGLKERLSLGKECLCKIPFNSKVPTLLLNRFKHPVLSAIQLKELKCRKPGKKRVILQKLQNRIVRPKVRKYNTRYRCKERSFSTVCKCHFKKQNEMHQTKTKSKPKQRGIKRFKCCFAECDYFASTWSQLNQHELHHKKKAKYFLNIDSIT